MYVGEKQALVVQQFQTFHKVAALALGGEEKKDGPKLKPNTELVIPQSAVEMQAAFYSVF